MRKIFCFSVIILFAILVGLPSCNKSLSAGVDDIEICFEAQCADSPFSIVADTKATAATSITSFRASVTTGTPGSETQASPCWSNVVFTSDGASAPTYVASPSKYWPLANPQYHVYAVAASPAAAAATAAAATNLTFGAAGTSITLASDVDKDVVCAYLPYGTTGGTTAVYKAKNALSFEHVFGRLSTVKVKAAGGYAVSNVSICLVNAKTGGTYNLRTGAGRHDGTGWSALSPADGSCPVLYTYAGTIAVGGSNTGSDNDLYLVPGTYFLRASWTAGIDNYTESFVDKVSSTPVSVVGGKVNAIEAVLGGNATEIRFAVSLSPWGSNTIGDVEFPVL